MNLIFDTETYPNCFLFCAEYADSPFRWRYEISDYRDQARELYEFLGWLTQQPQARMCGFNNVGFDYPILHLFIQSGGRATALQLYQKAKAIIDSQDENRFANIVYPSDRYIAQVDLFKIHHFDNKARSTSLKALEFNMRMQNISDLPFPVGSTLDESQIAILGDYCAHDVHATKLFYHKSLEQIRFRDELTATLGGDVINANDVKIGTLIFQMELEKSGVQCYEYGPNGRKPRQTLRPRLILKDAILPWISFETKGFQQVLDYLRSQVITETKGVFDDLVVKEYGLDFVFGTGGLHAAVENEALIAREDMLIESRDVASYYPNLSITNKFYPEHLGEKFCDVYSDIYNRRKTFKKGSVENAALKLALNGSYGKSNDKFSVFYDSLFTLKITLNGQLLLCLLIENLMKVPTLRVVMINTDGLEYTIHPDYLEQSNVVCDWWCGKTGLQLENARYKKLFIRDCNNYIGEYE